MKRQRRTYRAELVDSTGVLATADRYAWNSAVRASEALVRAYARSRGVILEGHPPQVNGGKPATPGAWYKRNWSGGDAACHVTVMEVSAA